MIYEWTLALLATFVIVIKVAQMYEIVIVEGRMPSTSEYAPYFVLCLSTLFLVEYLLK